MKRKEPIQISSDLIADTIEMMYGPKLKYRMQVYRLTEKVCPKVLGDLARYATNFKFERGTLSMRILSAPLRQNLVMQHDLLMKRLNEEMGEEFVEHITFY
ncbi:MAG: DciA family protein [Bacteroidales bacterium]|nr:DciA family protein [Bacteroidales bacterium]